MLSTIGTSREVERTGIEQLRKIARIIGYTAAGQGALK
jgi:hypothetical protein